VEVVGRPGGKNQEFSPHDLPCVVVPLKAYGKSAFVSPDLGGARPTKNPDSCRLGLTAQGLIKPRAIHDHRFRVRRRIRQLIPGRRIKSRGLVLSENRVPWQGKAGEGFAGH